MTTYTPQLVWMLHFAAYTPKRSINADDLRASLDMAGFNLYDPHAMRVRGIRWYRRHCKDKATLQEKVDQINKMDVHELLRHGWKAKQTGCTICGRSIPAGRYTFCSDMCNEYFLLHFRWGMITAYIQARDNWTCHDCGRTTVPRSGSHGLPWTDPYCWFDKAGKQVTRSEYQHQHCGDGCRHEPNPQYAGQLDIHHEVPLHAGGTNDHDNLLTLCNECHKARHKAEKAAIKAEHDKVRQATAQVALAKRASQNPSLERFT